MDVSSTVCWACTLDLERGRLYVPGDDLAGDFRAVCDEVAAVLGVHPDLRLVCEHSRDLDPDIVAEFLAFFRALADSGRVEFWSSSSLPEGSIDLHSIHV
jgi:hypothetical protein